MRLNNKYFFNPAHLTIAQDRYFRKDDKGNLVETDISQVFQREVDYIYSTDFPDHKKTALQYRYEKKIIPAGRPLAQAGTKIKNLLNCFVLGFEDDTREAISNLKSRHFHIQAQGGGTGMNFSTLRPRGSLCKTNRARSSGSIGFITDISYQSFNIQQEGARSGANMGTLEDWHPDLLEFITHKSKHNWENIRKFTNISNEQNFKLFQWQNPYQWQTFNVSVMLSDKFMEQVLSDSEDPWVLYWKDTKWHLWDFHYIPSEISQPTLITVTAPNQEIATYKALSLIPYFRKENLKFVQGPYDLPAKTWFKMICKNAWEDGCPGIIFSDVAKAFHNGEYYAPIRSTNPCAEQVLPENGVCCLTSLCLPSFLTKEGQFDFEDFQKAIFVAVRGLDNIIDLNQTGDDQIDIASRNERRIGLGTTGAAELLLLKGLKYSSKEGRDFIENILKVFRNTAYSASIELAKERGPFKNFDFKGYSKSKFFHTLPKNIQEQIEKYGIRNVTLLTQAPVGSTGTMLGYSQGCEPYFAFYFLRNSNSEAGSFIDGSPCFLRWLQEQGIDYKDYDFNLSKLRETISVPEYFEEAHEISVEDHLLMQALFAKYVDSSVSKTINLPNSATIEDVEQAYITAYNLGIKSTTIYRDGSKQQILEKIKPVLINQKKRPQSLECDIHHVSVKGEKWTVLVGLMNNEPYEIFCAPQESFELSQKYKSGYIIRASKGVYHLDLGDFKLKNINSLLESDEHRVITRLISTSLRHSMPIESLADQLEKAEGSVVDFSKAILRVIKKYMKYTDDLEGKKQNCPGCGQATIQIVSGCPQCTSCSYSKCS